MLVKSAMDQVTHRARTLIAVTLNDKALPWACHRVVMVELACLSDPKSYTGEDLVPGGFNCAGLVEG